MFWTLRLLLHLICGSQSKGLRGGFQLAGSAAAATWRSSCAQPFQVHLYFKRLIHGCCYATHSETESDRPQDGGRTPTELQRRSGSAATSNLSSPTSAGQDARTFTPPLHGRAALCGRIRAVNQRAGGRAEGAWSPPAAASLHDCSGRKPLGGAESHGTGGGGEGPGGRLQSSVGRVQPDAREAPHGDIYASFPPTGLTMVR